MDPKEARRLMDECRTLVGDYHWQRITARMGKERVNPYRDARKAVPWGEVRAMAKKQRWICGICKDPEKPMADDPRYTVCDHIDPNRKDFNARDNIQATHKSCNEIKNAGNQSRVSKRRQLGDFQQTTHDRSPHAT